MSLQAGTVLDGTLECCQSGELDECGVCDGDSSACALQWALYVALNASADNATAGVLQSFFDAALQGFEDAYNTTLELNVTTTGKTSTEAYWQREAGMVNVTVQYFKVRSEGSCSRMHARHGGARARLHRSCARTLCAACGFQQPLIHADTITCAVRNVNGIVMIKGSCMR